MKPGKEMRKPLEILTLRHLTSSHITISTGEVVVNPNGIVTKRLGFSTNLHDRVR